MYITISKNMEDIQHYSSSSSKHKKRASRKILKDTRHPGERWKNGGKWVDHEASEANKKPKRGENAPPLLHVEYSSPHQDVQRAAMDFNIPSSTLETSGGGSGMVVGFVDEEAVFNMPVLLDSMAEGMLLTPLAMTKGFSWSQHEVDDDGLELNLWGFNS